MGRVRDRRAPVRLALLALISGCVKLADEGGPWEPAESITGELAPELGPPIAAVPARDALRIASWNLHYAPDPELLAANVLASTEISQADVLLVQEVEAHPDEPATRTRRFAEALGMTWVYAPARTTGDQPGINGGTHGIAILSRLPIEAAQIRRLPYFEQPIHARTRNALAVDLVNGDARIRIVDVHLDVRIGAADRIYQLDPAAIDQPDPVILGGDFNSNPWAWIDSTIPLTGTEAVVGQDQAQIVDDYMTENAWTSALPAETATLRVPLYDIRIDDLYTRGLPIVAAGVEHVDGSDHWPLWLDVRAR